MFRTALWVGAVGAVLVSTPIAVADPSDLVPVCSGDQSPANDACSTGCPEGAPVDASGLGSEPGTATVTGGPVDQTAAVNDTYPEIPYS